MSIKTCTQCNKKMTAESSTCVFCGGPLKGKKSFTGLIIALVLISGIGFTGYSIYQSIVEKANELANSFEAAVEEVVVTAEEAVKTAVEESVEAQVAEKTADAETEAEPEEEVAESTYEDSQDEDDLDNAVAYDEVDPKVEERRKHWTKIYRDKFPLPVAGQPKTLRLKNGSIVVGHFMGVMGTVVKLEVQDEIKSISKTKLSTKSRLRMFCSDYVEYFVAKRLRDEGLSD